MPDVKQVIGAYTEHAGCTWKNVVNPDHPLTPQKPMTHLLVETIETKRTVTLNNQPKLKELFLSPSRRTEVVVHLKITGKAVTMLNQSISL